MNNNLKEVFSKNLKKYMERDDRTTADVMAATNASQSAVNDWLNAKKYPRMDKVEMLANYFSVRKSDLVEDQHKNLYFTQQEIELIEGYRKLDPNVRQFVFESLTTSEQISEARKKAEEYRDNYKRQAPSTQSGLAE
ncbi:MAG: helix-turn-helix domain-containing protein [Porphyromonadaceae bacterium]|nr:helix-turn-helix domain-containing protein [Porphyromonadaceae bacterium]